MPKFKRVKYNPVDYPNYNIAIPVINPQGTNLDDDNVVGYNESYNGSAVFDAANKNNQDVYIYTDYNNRPVTEQYLSDNNLLFDQNGVQQIGKILPEVEVKSVPKIYNMGQYGDLIPIMANNYDEAIHKFKQKHPHEYSDPTNNMLNNGLFTALTLGANNIGSKLISKLPPMGEFTRSFAITSGPTTILARKLYKTANETSSPREFINTLFGTTPEKDILKRYKNPADINAESNYQLSVLGYKNFDDFYKGLQSAKQQAEKTNSFRDNAAYRMYLRDREEVERLRKQRDQILEKYNKLSLQKKKEDQALQEELNDNRNSNKYKIYYK